MKVFVVPTDAPTIEGPPLGKWTLEDWEKLPDDGNRYEIINGVLFMTTAPSYFHHWIIKNLVKLIGIPTEEQGLGYLIFAPVGVIMPGCDPVQPDFAIVLRTNAGIIHDRRIYGVPDLIVEVISPGSVAYDQDTKLIAYANASVPEYAIINPTTRTLSLYKLETPGHYLPPQTFNEKDTVTFGCLPSISFRLGDLFEGAPDTTL